MKIELRPRMDLQGMTLVEVMIAAGISMTLVLATTQMTLNASRSTSSVKSTSDWSNLSSLIQLVLNTEQSCKSAFAGRTYSGGALPINALTSGGVTYASVTPVTNGINISAMQI